MQVSRSLKRIILLFLVSNPGNNVKTENGIRMEIKKEIS
jgi:hypothetical protein